VGHDLVYCCARRSDDGERRCHSLESGYAVLGQSEVGVLVDVIGTHDDSSSGLRSIWREVRSGCRVRRCGSARFMHWGGSDDMNEISEDNDKVCALTMIWNSVSVSLYSNRPS